MAQSCIFHFHAIGEKEAALELAGRNAPVEEFPAGLIGLPSTHHELVVFHADFEVGAGKTGHGNRDHEPFGTVWTAGALDIVGWIPFGRAGEPVYALLETVKAEEKGGGKHRYARHRLQSSLIIKQR